ncbi:MAG: hypothetical protein JO131_04355 [Gammaproteobacteria bacterium]|nr:hypothetical protein [Gammaproteobacteria bacterium]
MLYKLALLTGNNSLYSDLKEIKNLKIQIDDLSDECKSELVARQIVREQSGTYYMNLDFVTARRYMSGFEEDHNFNLFLDEWDKQHKAQAKILIYYSEKRWQVCEIDAKSILTSTPIPASTNQNDIKPTLSQNTITTTPSVIAPTLPLTATLGNRSSATSTLIDTPLAIPSSTPISNIPVPSSPPQEKIVKERKIQISDSDPNDLKQHLGINSVIPDLTVTARSTMNVSTSQQPPVNTQTSSVLGPTSLTVDALTPASSTSITPTMVTPSTRISTATSVIPDSTLRVTSTPTSSPTRPSVDMPGSPARTSATSTTSPSVSRLSTSSSALPSTPLTRIGSTTRSIPTPSSTPTATTPSTLARRSSTHPDLIVPSAPAKPVLAVSRSERKVYKEAEATLQKVARHWASELIDEKNGVNPLLVKPIKEWSEKEGSATHTTRILSKLDEAIKKVPTELNISHTAIKRIIKDEKTLTPIPSSAGSATGECNKDYLIAGKIADCEIIASNDARGGKFKEMIVGGLLKVIPEHIPGGSTSMRLLDDGTNIVPSLAKLQYVDAMFKPFLSSPNLLNKPLLIRGHQDVEYIRAVILLCSAYGLKINYEMSRQPSDILANYVPTSIEVDKVKQQIKSGQLTPVILKEDKTLLTRELAELNQAKLNINALPHSDKKTALLNAVSKAEEIIDETRKGKITGDTVKEFEKIVTAPRRR